MAALRAMDRRTTRHKRFRIPLRLCLIVARSMRAAEGRQPCAAASFAPSVRIRVSVDMCSDGVDL